VVVVRLVSAYFWFEFTLNNVRINFLSLWLIDNMAYTRGSKDDWDKWANITGDEEMSWDRMFSYMMKVGNYIPYMV
jgi:hypothetical protein